MDITSFDDAENKVICNGFEINEAWQAGCARMHDVRQTVATGHMKEHAMVASDYAIKVINFFSKGNRDAVILEREWQIRTLTACLENGKEQHIGEI